MQYMFVKLNGERVITSGIPAELRQWQVFELDAMAHAVYPNTVMGYNVCVGAGEEDRVILLTGVEFSTPELQNMVIRHEIGHIKLHHMVICREAELAADDFAAKRSSKEEIEEFVKYLQRLIDEAPAMDAFNGPLEDTRARIVALKAFLKTKAA